MKKGSDINYLKLGCLALPFVLLIISIVVVMVEKYNKADEEQRAETELKEKYSELDAKLYSQGKRFAQDISYPTQWTGSGYLKGKVMVVDRDRMERSFALDSVPKGLWARTPEEVGTVVVVHCSEVPSPSYDCYEQKRGGGSGQGQNAGSARAGVCNVTAVEWLGKKVIAAKSFIGEPACTYVEPPTKQVSDYLKNLPRQ
ncbi:MAG: hypothetical protein H7Z38_17965 [Rubrivivax sp.]|nr:hypothetical protein [Pyrinomonadaceae bacterium]